MSSAKRLIRASIPRWVRNWLRSPRDSLFWMVDEARHAAGGDRCAELRPGWSVICHPAAYRVAYRAQVEDPEQRTEFDAFLSACKSGMRLFDLGAHFGLFSLAALHFGGHDAQAVAVDPSPTAIRLLRIQARLNRVSGRLHLVQASVSRQSGWQPMVAVGVVAGGYFISPDAEHEGNEVTQTRATTVDDLADDFGFAPTHIKIDVEGAELAVLRGGENTLADRRGPLLFIELHNRMVRLRGGDPADCLSLLDDYGYSVSGTDFAPLEAQVILDHELVRVIARKR